MKAFPWHEGFEKEAGMDLRDYFAAKVVGGIIAAGDSYNINLMAEYAYQLADAMMKAREENSL